MNSADKRRVSVRQGSFVMLSAMDDDRQRPGPGCDRQPPTVPPATVPPPTVPPPTVPRTIQARHRRTEHERRLDERIGQLASRLGSGLREARLMTGRGQTEAAARAGLSQPRYSELERGKGAGATIGTWVRAADAVGQRF